MAATEQSGNEFVGPLKIAALLWDKNPKNASQTLRRAINTALERDSLPALREALQAMRGPMQEVLDAADARDPRLAPACAGQRCSIRRPAWNNCLQP